MHDVRDEIVAANKQGLETQFETGFEYINTTLVGGQRCRGGRVG